MEQKQIRPVRHVHADPRRDEKADDLWPRSAREFLQPPSLTNRRKGFTFKSGEKPSAADK